MNIIDDIVHEFCYYVSLDPLTVETVVRNTMNPKKWLTDCVRLLSNTVQRHFIVKWYRMKGVSCYTNEQKSNYGRWLMSCMALHVQ